MPETPLGFLLAASIAEQTKRQRIFSQEDKLAWSESIRDVSLQLYKVAADCPHGHQRNEECERCFLLHSLVGQLEAIAKHDLVRTMKEGKRE